MHNNLKLTVINLQTATAKTLEQTHKILVQNDRSSGGHADNIKDTERNQIEEARLPPE